MFIEMCFHLKRGKICKKQLSVLAVWIIVFITCCSNFKSGYFSIIEHFIYGKSSNVNRRWKSSNTTRDVYYNKYMPLVWIGGIPRSGTTLMRAMLDAHPDVRCGEETRVIPRILGMHAQMSKSQLEMTRLQEAKITESILDRALGSYMLSVIVGHGETAPRLCNKDPFALRSMIRLVRIFPKSKFLLMLRDGRATVYSIISRGVTIKGFDTKSWHGALRDWNRAIQHMYHQCQLVGTTYCIPVHYERLVLHPEMEMRKILHFLEIKWNIAVLHHEKAIGKNGGVSLSKRELSTDQVDKPLYTDALNKWVGHVPPDIIEDIDNIAPMLATLGYDPHANPPEYSSREGYVHSEPTIVENQNKENYNIFNQQINVNPY